MMRMLVAAGLVMATAPAVAVPASFKARADRIIAVDSPAAAPGMSAITSQGNRILWQGASGKADLATLSALRTDSLFRFASITKQFTAVLVLRLVEDGRLGLDDKVGKLLPGRTPAAWHRVTVRQLLNHTSGIPSYTSHPGFMAPSSTARAITTQQLIDVTRDSPIDFAPGSDWRYNNTGYVLLSAIVEARTGKPWYAALRERVTGPLGLSSIRCGCEPGPATVAGYNGEGKPAQVIDMTVPSGAGALVGNVGDLARWAHALHGGKVLKPASYQAMIAPTALPDGRKMPYGFGIGTAQVRGMDVIGHNGGIPGFNTESLYLPSQGLFVAVLANSEATSSGMIARRLLAEAAGNPFPMFTAQALDLAALAPFLGVYKDKDVEHGLSAKDGKLYAQRVGGGTSEVFHAGANRYFYGPSSLSFFVLGRNDKGAPVMTFHAEGAEEGVASPRVGDLPPEVAAVVLPSAQLDVLVGNYAAGPMVLAIARNGAGLTGQLTGQGAIPLEPIGAREFRTVGVDARLVFEEENGKIVRLQLHQGGHVMPFERR